MSTGMRISAIVMIVILVLFGVLSAIGYYNWGWFKNEPTIAPVAVTETVEPTTETDATVVLVTLEPSDN